MVDLSKFDDVITDFARDNVKVNDGVWMTYKRFQYQVARAHRDNVAFAKLMEERMRPFQWAIERNNLAALKDVANDVLQGIYAETCLKGIRRVAVGDKPAEALDYDADTGVALFKKLPDLWDAVFKFANAEENYSPDAIAADSKN